VLLLGLAGICLVAMLITRAFRIETLGKSFEEISGAKIEALGARPVPG